MAWIALGVALIGAAGTAASAPKISSTPANFGGSNFAFDNSGWNINFGSGALTSSATKTTSQGTGVPVPGVTTLPGIAGVDQQTLMIAGMGLVVVMALAWKRKRKH